MLPVGDVIPKRTRPAATLGLIGVTALSFVVQAMLSSSAESALVAALGAGAAPAHPVAGVTSLFLHRDALHVGITMLYLWVFGPGVEDRMGHVRFAALYVACGAVAVLAPQWLIPPDATHRAIGASAAVSGVLGAYLLLYPTSRVLMLWPWPRVVAEVPALSVLGAWILLHLLSALGGAAGFEVSDTTGGIPVVAHPFAFVLGGVLCVAFRRPERLRVDWWSVEN